MAGRQDRMGLGGEPLEQFRTAFKQFLDGVHQEALAEAPGARQEVVFAAIHQPPDVAGLVNVVVAPLADLAEGLEAEGSLRFTTTPRSSGTRSSQAGSASKATTLRVFLLNSTPIKWIGQPR